jgi:hypothetical protein
MKTMPRSDARQVADRTPRRWRNNTAICTLASGRELRKRFSSLL